MVSGIGDRARFLLTIGAVVIVTGFCLVALAEVPTTSHDDSIKQLEEKIRQQETLIKQQENLIRQQEGSTGKQKTSIEQQEALIEQQDALIKQQKTKAKQRVQTTKAGSNQEPQYVSVSKGKILFKKWCSGCHNPNSKAAKIGPGIKGILKGKKLPISGLGATPDNIRRQMRTPHELMPTQFGLTDEQIDQLIKYLETL